ncbi:MAG: DUF1150 family protein [Hyphomicrobiales bacterium]
MEKNLPKFDEQALAALGGGVVGYVKEIEGADAVKLLGDRVAVPPHAKLFCLYNADGSPISISGSREAAITSAIEHELVPASLH